MRDFEVEPNESHEERAMRLRVYNDQIRRSSTAGLVVAIVILIVVAWLGTLLLDALL